MTAKHTCCPTDTCKNLHYNWIRYNYLLRYFPYFIKKNIPITEYIITQVCVFKYLFLLKTAQDLLSSNDYIVRVGAQENAN